jgi:hypothetical protein
MSALARVALAAAAVLGLAGCQHQAYEIHPLFPNQPVGAGLAAEANSLGGVEASVAVGHRYRPEVFPAKLDGYWFERVIFGSGGKTSPDAIELVYCPILPGGTVCRTATIWQKGITNLLESGNAAR